MDTLRYILSESVLCHSTAVEICICLMFEVKMCFVLMCSVCKPFVSREQRAVSLNPTQDSSLSLKKVFFWVLLNCLA